MWLLLGLFGIMAAAVVELEIDSDDEDIVPDTPTDVESL